MGKPFTLRLLESPCEDIKAVTRGLEAPSQKCLLRQLAGRLPYVRRGAH